MFIKTYNERRLIALLAKISDMCIGEIAMGCKLDANTIGQMIFEVTGKTSEELNKITKEC